MNGKFWKLIEEVRAINPTAAGKLYRMAKKPPAFSQSKFIDAFALGSAFVWSDTVEGHFYWSNLDRFVEKRRLSPIHRLCHPGD